MSRNKSFNPEREPFRSNDSLQLMKSKVEGPLTFLNPTQAKFHHVHNAKGFVTEKQEQDSDQADLSSPEKEEQPASNVTYKWTSRNNRKGRHALVVRPVDASSPGSDYETPLPSSHWRKIMHTVFLMVYYYPVWDISWWVAYIFTWGSIIWVINAFFSFLPDIAPSTAFPNEVLVGGGITAFIGATVFEIGSVLLMFEAINENRSGCFGWAVEQLIHDQSHSSSTSAAEKGHKQPRYRIRASKDHCTHHHANRHNFVGAPRSSGLQHNSPTTPGYPQSKAWTWFPSTHDLRTQYLHDLGFIACFSQLCGATIFWIAGFTALPGIYNHLSPAAVNGAYWFPQVLGGCGFVISGFLFMVETQKHWYLPAPKVLGWHIGVWNFIGGIGFTLCPCFGFDTASWAQYQAGCSTFWGSWAFLIGSLIQLYESLEKDPVEVEKKA